MRDIFLRALGLVSLCAFLSLLSQVTLLVGEHGLLPAREFLDFLRPRRTILETPTIFWLGASDRALVGAAWAGVAASAALTLGLAPRFLLVLLWGLYLSFVSIGQAFLAFQWDNLLLESYLFAFFVAPSGLVLRRRSPSPHPLGTILVLSLVFRLHFESGLAKLIGGDPTWLNLTAMESYYETAPIPTWVGWWFHQLPPWAHKATTALTLVAEVFLPFLILAGRRARAVLFVTFALMHGLIFVTANYCFFGILSVVLCLFLLDDGHLAWIAKLFGKKLREREPRADSSGTKMRAALATATIAFAFVSFVPFVPFLGYGRDEVPGFRAVSAFRTVNAYHLFVHMTGLRDEVTLMGSMDGEKWEEYELRYKAGDPARPPPFVAPHQPRVDFRLWFVALSGRASYPPEFLSLIRKVLVEPEVVSPLFSRMPFGGAAPRFLRIDVYRYKFTDLKTRRATGDFWVRENIATWEVRDGRLFFTADDFR